MVKFGQKICIKIKPEDNITDKKKHQDVNNSIGAENVKTKRHWRSWFFFVVFSWKWNNKLPLSLPVDKAEWRVKKQPHFSQRPLAVDAEEEVWGGRVLDGHIYQFSWAKSKTEDTLYHNAIHWGKETPKGNWKAASAKSQRQHINRWDLFPCSSDMQAMVSGIKSYQNAWATPGSRWTMAAGMLSVVLHWSSTQFMSWSEFPGWV